MFSNWPTGERFVLLKLIELGIIYFMAEQSALFIYQHSEEMVLEDGKPYYCQFSHIRNVMLGAHEALRAGWKVYLKSQKSGAYREFTQIFPIVHCGPELNFFDENFQPKNIFSVYDAQDLIVHKPHKPTAKGIVIISANHWLEEMDKINFGVADLFRLAFSQYVDYVVTQNQRMKEVLLAIVSFVTKWYFPERILVATNGYAPEEIAAEKVKYDRATIRQQMGLTDNNIALINSGGVCPWNDYFTFLKGLVAAIKMGATRVRVFQMGIRNPVIIAHEAFENSIRQFYIENFDVLYPYLDILDWDEASAALPAYNYGADMGINVNPDSLENYQSHRVRIVDYVKTGLPIFTTEGEYQTNYGAKYASVRVQAGNVDEYRDALLAIDNGSIDLQQLAAEMQKFRLSYASDIQWQPVLETIANGTPLPAETRYIMTHEMQNIYQRFGETFNQIINQL